MRTFSREHWEAAQQAWTDGRFSDEWKPYRHQAAMRGMIYPPEGDRHDSWEDDSPSQRAMLVRAIRETPALLKAAIEHSRKWDDVIEYILKRRDEWRDEIDAKDRDLIRHKRDLPDERESLVAIGNVFEKVAESLGYERKVSA